MSDTQTSAVPSVEILIVEDSPTQAQRLRHILEQQRFHVIGAANGREAIDVLQRRKPALIISDIVMPEMDGYDLCRQVKSDPSLADIPVILVTTMSSPEDVIRGLECRADNFILKPYDERYLLGRVQFVLVNREMRQSDQPGMGLEIFFNGKKHFITADRLQILNLLLSTYDAAMQQNSALNRAQDRLREANARLEAVNSDLEAFAHTVSHDLRAPLRHVSGYANFLSASDTSALSEKDRGYLDNITNSTQHMASLIDDLLEFSRMGLVELRPVSIDAQTLLDEILQNLQPEITGRNIAWKKNSLPLVQADRALLRQVFANLLLNAVKYTRSRNPAEIEIGCQTDSAEEFVIFVRDNGAGFDMKYADKLFGVFQRLHSREEFEGTGVGLATVRRIIAKHGGRTWAEGKIDSGATFYFTLPKKAAAISA